MLSQLLLSAALACRGIGVGSVVITPATVSDTAGTTGGTLTGVALTPCLVVVTSDSIAWRSTNTAVVTVVATDRRHAVWTAVGAGSAKIFGKIQAKEDSTQFTVSGAAGGDPGAFAVTTGSPLPPCTGISLTPASAISVVTGAATGTHFCLGPGTYTRFSAVAPKTGQQFFGTGTFGQVILTGLDTAKYAFQSISSTPSNGIIKYIVFEHYASPNGFSAIHMGDNSRGWIFDSNEVRRNRYYGLRAGSLWHVGYNYIHHNGEGGIAAYRAADSMLIIGNRVDSNPPVTVVEQGISADASQMKIFGAVGTVIEKNLVQGGGNKGIWLDTDNNLDTIRNNIVRNQKQECIWWEANYRALISGNTVSGCTGAGIQVTNSYVVVIRDNVISTSGTGIQLYSVLGGTNYTGPIWPESQSYGLKAMGAVLRNNQITQTTGLAVATRASGANADTAYTSPTFAFKTTADSNRYNTTGASLSAWMWDNTVRTKSQWQGLGLDLHAVFVP